MNYQALSIAFASAKALVSRFFQSIPDQQLLDPMSTLIRLALISYCEKGSKLSICDNSIQIQEPGLLQGAIRWTQGDKRTDLHNLYAPIEKALEWYNPKNDKSLSYIYQLAKEGLRSLKVAYSETGHSNLVAHTISYYITIIDNKLKGIDAPINPETTLAESVYREDTGINRLQTIWTPNEIKIVYFSLKQMSEAKTKGADMENYISSITSILEGKDKLVREMIHRRTTTF